MSKSTKGKVLHKVFMANIVLGIGIFIAAVYFMVTADYASLSVRQQSETTLNVLAIGGLLYSAVFWYIDLYLHPQFPARES